MERFSRIESIGNIRLMQDIRPKQEKRDCRFAEILNKENKAYERNMADIKDSPVRVIH